MSGFRVLADDREWTQREIEGLAGPWTQALRGAGVRSTESVGLLFQNGLPFLVAFEAVRGLSASISLIPPRAVAGAQAAGAARQVGARVVLVGPGLSGVDFPAEVQVVHVESATQRLEIPVLQRAPRPAPAGIALFTSGTRGTPRAVLLKEEVFRAHARAAAKTLRLGPEDRWLATISFAHVGGLAMMLRCEELGSTLILPAAGPLDGASLDDIVRRDEVTHLSLVPTQLYRWLGARGKMPPPAALKAVLVGGAPTTPSLLSRAREAGIPVRLTYGMTEAYSQVATADDETPEGSVGHPLEGVEVRIREPAGEDAIGEIDVRSPYLFDRYVRDPSGPSGSRAGEWFATGDLGRVDGDGNLWIVGRLGDRINTGGLKVDPAEVDAAISALPGVRETCTIGVPDPEWGEVIASAVVLEGGSHVSLEDIGAHARRHLPPYKVPKRFLLLADLPRNASGKVVRAELRRFFEVPANSTVY